MHPGLDTLVREQEQLLTRQQALTFMSQAEVTARLGKFWQVLLPGVYATFTGALTSRHRLLAALLHAGPDSMVNDLTALRMHRVAFLPDEPFTRVLVRACTQRSSRDFVVVRRTTRLPTPQIIDGLPTAPLVRALCEYVARHGDERESFAAAAAAVQARHIRLETLTDEVEHGPNRGRPKLIRMLASLEAGARSAPEDDFRRLVLRSKVLPPPLLNCLLQLPGGGLISPDALFADAGLVHETNGRRFHAAEDTFDDMQRRHDALVTAGLTVLHNAPRRLSADSAGVLRQVELCHNRLAGRGLPPGVIVLRPGPP
jgi:hypothetical protein